MINVASVVVSAPFAKKFQIKRFAGSFSNEGTYTRDAGTLIDRVGSVQPASAQDVLEFMPEGERDGKYVKCYSNQAIIKGDGAGVESDHILHLGSEYRVVYTKLYQEFGYWFVIGEAI